MSWHQSQLDQLDPVRKRRLSNVINGTASLAERLWLAPHKIMELGGDTQADEWQKKVLYQLMLRHENTHILCSRGAGKSKVFAAASYLEGVLGGFSIIFSRSDEQAMEVMRYVKQYHRFHNLVPIVADNQHTLEFAPTAASGANGGRILVRPYSGHTVIGKHGVTLLGIDEAARISDDFFAVVTPMLSVSERVTGIKPRMALMSTPFGKRGFFYRISEEARDPVEWRYHKYPWRSCPRILPATVAKYTREHGELWARQEYGCEFLDNELAYFDTDLFIRGMDSGLQLDNEDECNGIGGGGNEDFRVDW